VYDGPNVVLDLDAATLEPISAYVHGPGIDQPIEWLRLESGFPEAPARAVYHTDGLGSVVAMTRGSGSGALVLRTYSYEAFGKVRVETEAPFAPANRYTYTARESIGDSTGLMYYRWRVMDPNTGRFTSEDPLGFKDGPSLYLYVGLNPVNDVDPQGLAATYQCTRVATHCFYCEYRCVVIAQDDDCPWPPYDEVHDAFFFVCLGTHTHTWGAGR
jgi:RHS repeat-associated protein